MSKATNRTAGERRADIARARWWLAYPVAILLLALLDAGLSFWRPLPSRLPEQFSPAYLRLYFHDVPRQKPAVLFLGDSVLWGYKLEESDTAVARLQRHFARALLLNLSYEGGSTPNSAVLLHYAIRSGIKPAAVVVGINVKEFNQADSAYRVLHPSLELAAAPILTTQDRRLLQLHERFDLNARLNRRVERVWRFYALRSDLRERIFGTDDMAGLLVRLVQQATGTAASVELAHRPTPDRFLGTYDLAPIERTNVAMVYYRSLLHELCARGIPGVVFLTPTNHKLLHEYIDVPEYQANLRRLMAVPRCSGITLLDLDDAMPSRVFIDNDHLNAQGQRLLADRLRAAMSRIIP